MAKESKHVKHFQQKHIKPEEQIIAFGDGYIGEMMGTGDKSQQNGSLLVTNQRVAFVRKGLFGEIVETIPLKNITSIERKSLLGMRRIEIHTSHDSLKFKTGDKTAESAMVEAIENFREGSTKTNNNILHQQKSSKERLAELKELFAEGLLSDEDFEQKKLQILSEL